jgi:hypothetical protein
MPTHVVRQGECAASIAARFGLTAETLMDREGNRALRDARDNVHVLSPGDVLDVPPPAERRIPFSSGGTARYKARVPKTHLRLKLVLPNGDAAANEPFEVSVPGGREPIAGTTDGEGVLDVEMAVTHTRAVVRVFRDGDHAVEVPVLVGHLDPVGEASGVRGRLANLGYAVGEGPDALSAAVRAFQRHEELVESGTVDDETRARLVERHGT